MTLSNYHTEICNTLIIRELIQFLALFSKFVEFSLSSNESQYGIIDYSQFLDQEKFLDQGDDLKGLNGVWAIDRFPKISSGPLIKTPISPFYCIFVNKFFK